MNLLEAIGGTPLVELMNAGTKPGVRIFRTSDGSEITQAPLDLGLPPFDILFLK